MSKCAALKRGELTEEERLELDLKLEDELKEKIRQFNYLNQGGKHGKIPGASKMGRQHKALQIMKNEEFQIQLDLTIATSKSKKRVDQQTKKEMRVLMDDYQTLTDQINIRKTELKEVEDEITKTKQLINSRVKLTVSDYAYTKMVQEGENTVAALENKLDTNLKGFCKIITENHKLRAEIQHLMITRKEFNKQWNFIVGNLNKGKTFMMDIVEQATIAYDQREEWLTKLNALRKRARVDFLFQIEEMNNLQYRLHNDRKTEDFIGKKCQRRIMMDLEKLKVAEMKNRRLNIENNLKHYGNMLLNISEFMGAGPSDIHLIVYKFMQGEEKNYSQFGYLCVLGKEIEDLSEQIYKLHSQIDMQRKLKRKRTIQQEQNINKLKDELSLTTKETNKAQAKYDKMCGVLNKLCDGVQKLFVLCKCKDAPLLQLLGDNSRVNNDNVLLHLNLLEDEIERLLMACYYKQVIVDQKNKKLDPEKFLINDKQTPGTIYKINEIVTSNPCPLCVDQEMVSDVIDDLQKVETKQEVALRLKERLELPDALGRIHNVSACHLPKSRQIIQRRYQ